MFDELSRTRRHCCLQFFSFVLPLPERFLAYVVVSRTEDNFFWGQAEQREEGLQENIFKLLVNSVLIGVVHKITGENHKISGESLTNMFFNVVKKRFNQSFLKRLVQGEMQVCYMQKLHEFFLNNGTADDDHHDWH